MTDVLETPHAHQPSLADLSATYALSIDERDYATIASLFEPDGRHRSERFGREVAGLQG